MAFKPVIAKTKRYPFVTIATSGGGRVREMTLTAETLRNIGEPRAVAFEWDDEDALLRISAASPESPEASPLGKSLTARVTVTALLRQLGVTVESTTRFPVTQDGPLAVIADLSEYRS